MKLSELDGGYRFLIDREGNLYIGNRSSQTHPRHKDLAELFGLDPSKVLGGYAEIWDSNIVFTGEAFGVTAATKEDLIKAIQSEIRILSENSDRR